MKEYASLTNPAIVEKINDPQFPAAFEANHLAHVVGSASVPGGEVDLEGPAPIYISGLPNAEANGVLGGHFAPGLDAHALGERIRTILTRFAARGVPMIWWITPSTQPGDLGDHLVANGLIRLGAGPGMVAEMAALSPVASPSGLYVAEVRDEETMRQWGRTFVTASGLPAVIADHFLAMYASQEHGPDRTCRYYIGTIDEQPVATVISVLAGGVAGIYSVATLPELRRRGIGASMTLAACNIAGALGYRLAVLHASALGRPVYERLGFRECWSLPVYGWQLDRQIIPATVR